MESRAMSRAANLDQGKCRYVCATRSVCIEVQCSEATGSHFMPVSNAVQTAC